MSAGTVSLESAIRNCKVNTAWANRVESDRFLNQQNMVCPLWNGQDSAGRKICSDSFNTKSAGCHSATDRVEVENNVSRPQYMQYVTLSSDGINGKGMYDNNTSQRNSMMRTEDLRKTHKMSGYAGGDRGASIYPSCGYNAYKDGMAQNSNNRRNEQAKKDDIHEGYMNHKNCGF